MSKSMQIGIIGDGRFGSLLANTIKKHWQGSQVKVYARRKTPNQKNFFTLAETCDVDLLIPCVPISVFKSVLEQIQPLIRQNTTVMDVCSVKIKPVQWMQAVLGSDAKIIASHPVFGPDSSDNGKNFHGLNLMIENISADPEIYKQIKNFWDKLGVNILEMTAEEHDRYSAYTINYNHLIGRIGEIVGIKPTPIDTKGFVVIYEALQYVTNDTWELFTDMQNFNPFAKQMRKDVAAALKEIETRLQADPNY